MDFKDVLRYIFIALNMVITLAAVCGFIYANVKYARVYYMGSFIGGFMPTVALFFILFGLLGVFAGFKDNKMVMTGYCGLTLCSLLLRLINWMMFAAHHLAVDRVHYLYLVLEIVLGILSAILCR